MWSFFLLVFLWEDFQIHLSMLVASSWRLLVLLHLLWMSRLPCAYLKVHSVLNIAHQIKYLSCVIAHLLKRHWTRSVPLAMHLTLHIECISLSKDIAGRQILRKGGSACYSTFWQQGLSWKLIQSWGPKAHQDLKYLPQLVTSCGG